MSAAIIDLTDCFRELQIAAQMERETRSLKANTERKRQNIVRMLKELTDTRDSAPVERPCDCEPIA